VAGGQLLTSACRLMDGRLPVRTSCMWWTESLMPATETSIKITFGSPT